MTPVPFVIGQWVRGERFYGRERLIGEVLDGPRNGLWLLGTRRIGKTSLLKQLEYLTADSPERGYFPLFWDLQGADVPAELHAGFADALLDAEERLESLGVDIGEVEAEDLFTSMGRLRRKLRGRKLKLLLLCDEVEELIKLNQKDPALLAKLRRSMQSSDDVRAVLASTIRLWALTEQRADTSPFLHGFAPPLYIGMMSDDGARALLRQDRQPAELRPGFSDEQVETARMRCDNHPYLLQLVGKRLLEGGELERAIEEVAADQMVAYFFSVDFEMLPPIEQEVLRTVARDTPAASDTLEGRLALDTPTLASSLQNLEQLGFIRRDAERHVILANWFFRRWLTDLAAATGTTAASRGSTTPVAVAAGATTARRTAAGSLLDDRYELRRKAGEGATGHVYEAWDRVLETRIAVKLLRREYAGNSLVLERFRQEILLSRNLGHPNILRAYHLGRHEGLAYLTMQWVDGPTLATTIEEEAPLPDERVAFIGARLASALEAAHAHNVLHRDVKPQNVLIERSGEPLITDFGLARLLEGPGVTTAGVFLGTPNYVSPEQSRLEPLDARSDVYSLGVVLFEMATGRCPFRGDSAGEVMEMHRSVAPPDPREMAHGVSAELAGIILSCLEKDRQARMSAAGELRSALEGLLPGGEAAPHRGAVVTRIGAGEIATEEDPGGSDEKSHHASADELIGLVYDELRRLARGFLSRERPDHTLQPTALVHEAYMRLAKQQAVDWAGRTHFFAVGANIMRRLLIDHARTRGRQKRGGDMRKVTLQEAITPGGGRELGFDELLSLDKALAELAAIDARQAAIVELRFFGGLTVAEAAEHLGVSKRTVEADWTAAREWLRRRLADGPPPDG